MKSCASAPAHGEFHIPLINVSVGCVAPHIHTLYGHIYVADFMATAWYSQCYGRHLIHRIAAARSTPLARAGS
jgi:hypothetical protein